MRSVGAEARTNPASDELWSREDLAHIDAAHQLLALGEMTRGIAHDFRNLLAAIDSGLRLMERNAADPEKRREYIEAIDAAVGQGLGLVDRLLGFAMHHGATIGEADLGQLLADLEPLLRYVAGPNVKLVLDTSSTLPLCAIDPVLFDAAVLNLVSNARDAMPTGGTIRVSARLSSGGKGRGGDRLTCVQVRVEDTGRGMTEETIRRAFEPYFSTKGIAGTGIGLPQVRSFMQLVGGRIEISSRPGNGTRCDLLFPAVLRPEELERA